MLDIDFVVYNVNFDLYQYVKLKFEVDGAGYVSKKITYTNAIVDYFGQKSSGLVDSHSGSHILEIICGLYIIYETVKLIRNVYSEWKFLQSIEDDQAKQRSSTDNLNCILIIVIFIKTICQMFI